LYTNTSPAYTKLYISAKISSGTNLPIVLEQIKISIFAIDKVYLNHMLKRIIISFLLLCINLPGASAQTPEVLIREIASKINAKIGVSAKLLETNDTVGYRADQKYPMQSVYKFPIAMAILDQVDRKKLKLTQMVKVEAAEIIPRGVSPIREKYPTGTSLNLEELLRLNIEESDGTACDVLIRLMGGTNKVQQYIKNLGIINMNIATTEMVQISDDWIQYKNWCTPAATTLLLEKLSNDSALSQNSTSLLLNWMEKSVPGNKRLKGNLPEGTVVAHKPGTSGTFDGLTRATNDVGIITLPNGKHLAISVFVSDAYGTMTEKEQVIAAISKTIFDHFNK
jgi:beta-lactamase class A